VTGGATPDDHALLAELRRIAVLGDPVPEGWRAAAGVGLAWASIPAEAARLAYDHRALPGRSRSDLGSLTSGVRELRYATGTSAVELSLEIEPVSRRVRLTGRLDPARPAAISVVWPEGREDTQTDGEGAFLFQDLPRRPLCVVVAGDHPVKTAWIVP
jgi:hypothetical protein